MKYFMKAFLYRWNLLVVFAGIAMGVISGYPDIIIPLLAAAEILLISLVGTNSRFQAIVNANESAADLSGAKLLDEKTRRLFDQLSGEDKLRFRRLKTLCLKLQQIARQANIDSESELAMVADVQTEGINRLLWIYLKLLCSKNALNTYFATVNKAEIESEMRRAEKMLGQIKGREDDPDDIKWRDSLLDTMATSRQRLENYNSAVEKHKFVELELSRLYTKIAGLAEMGIHRRDSVSVIHEIDIASTSIEQTKDALNEMAFLTGISVKDEAPPDLLMT